MGRASERSASRAGLLAALPLAFVLLRCSSPYTEVPASPEGGTSTPGTGPASSGDGSATPPTTNPAGPDGAAGAPSADGGSDAPPLGPGEIFCASTTTICDVRSADCCLTVSGTASAAARTFNASSAACIPTGAPNCGAYVGVGDDFTMKLPQRCASTRDCTAGTVCCVLPVGGDRYAKEIREISCQPMNKCNSDGRVLCTQRSDCLTTESCLPETDPVLGRLYASFCR